MFGKCGTRDTNKNETHTESEERVVILTENKLGVNVKNNIDIEHNVGRFTSSSNRVTETATEP